MALKFDTPSSSSVVGPNQNLHVLINYLRTAGRIEMPFLFFSDNLLRDICIQNMLNIGLRCSSSLSFKGEYGVESEFDKNIFLEHYKHSWPS